MGTVFNEALTAQVDFRGLRDAFSPRATYEAFLEIEQAVALVQGQMAMIPQSSAEAIARNCRYDLLDMARIEAGYRVTQHPLMPLINELVRLCGPEHGGYVHWGITTQNVVQTGLLLLAKRAQRTLDAILRDILSHLGRLAREHAATNMAGRTHFRHAVPITFGFKAAVWIDELLQAADRLQDAQKRALVVMMGGAVGCFSAIGSRGPEFQSRVAGMLGMEEMAVPSRAIRAHICEYVNGLSLLASACHQIAEEVYQTSSEEFGELHEKRVNGAIGSSTMPQKINPVHCYGIIANSNKLYGQAAVLMANAYRPFESDGSTNLLFEDTLVEVIASVSEVLVRTEALLGGLELNPARMRDNLRLSNGAIFGEYAMMRLGREVGKHKGHEMVHDAAIAAISGDGSFLDQLATLPGGPALSQDIRAMIETDSAAGLCKEYAQHFAGLMEAIGDGPLPTPEQRKLRVDTT
jgi:adenylosuccinate lyase